MKDMMIIIVIVVAIFLGSYYSYIYYEKLYRFYSIQLENLVNQIENDTSKEETIAKIEEKWHQDEIMLIILQDHSSIGRIEENLYECFHYYRMNDMEKLIMARDKTLSGMEDLIKREELLLVDIL